MNIPTNEGLDNLQNFTGLNPVAFYEKFASEVVQNKHYYMQFKTASAVAKAVHRRLTAGSVYDFLKQKWVNENEQ